MSALIELPLTVSESIVRFLVAATAPAAAITTGISEFPTMLSTDSEPILPKARIVPLADMVLLGLALCRK
jgi:hypothetical protein